MGDWVNQVEIDDSFQMMGSVLFADVRLVIS
jgi:hypothetical protein